MTPVYILLVIFTFVYLAVKASNNHKERMYLIRQGINPEEADNKELLQFKKWDNNMKAGLILVGVGFGFLMAVVISDLSLTLDKNDLIFPLVSLCGGIMVLIHYIISRKEYERIQKEMEKKKKAEEEFQSFE